MPAVPIRSRVRRPEPIHTTAVVLEVDGLRIAVQTESDTLDARLAVSCLLRPECRDKVLVSGPSAGDCYIIAVLERDPATVQRLQLHGNAVLSVDAGSLTVEASERVELKGGDSMFIGAPQFDLRATKANVLFGELSAIGRIWNGALGQLRLVGETLDTIVQRVTQHTKTSLRTVEETDQVRSGHIDYRAEANVHVQGQNTLVNARELVKLNGDQVHVG